MDFQPGFFPFPVRLFPLLFQLLCYDIPMIKAVFLDNDGTLFSHSLHKIPESALKALYALQERGIKVVLTTGRDMSELLTLGIPSFPFDGYILMNGQLCLEKDLTPYFGRPIEGKQLERMVALFEEKKIPMTFYDSEGSYVNFVNDYVVQVQADVSSPVPPILPYRHKDIYLTVFFVSKEDVDALGLDDFTVTRWNPYAIDVVVKGSSKWEGIRQYMARYGLSVEEVMAVGDGENDMEMVKNAGTGVAMGNSEKALLDIADYVTDDIDEDGLYKLFTHYNMI